MGEIGEKAMYKFDDSFLESVGLAGMPAEQKEAFLQYAQDQLEVRIGEKMSEGLSDAQLDEFEKIIDNDQATLDKWLAGAGDYKSDVVYRKLAENIGGSEEDILSDYVTAKWLDQNCPQYQQIIQESVSALTAEISANKDALLANM
jgi:hypothetical protein